MDDFEPKKSINRIATPIKLDEQGNKILEEKPEVVIKEKTKKRNILPILIFLLISLLIFNIGLIYYAFTLKNTSNKEESTITNSKIRTIKTSYQIASGTIGNNFIINDLSSYEVSSKFKISVSNLNLYINEKLVLSRINLINKVALVHDLIMLDVINLDNQSIHLYAFDINGNIVYELTKINKYMELTNEINYSTIGFNIKTTNVLGSIITLDHSYNICDYRTLGEYNISDSTPVISEYFIEYLGDHKFSEPKLIKSVLLKEYRKMNNLCTN